MIIAFVDFNSEDEKTSSESHQLISVLEELSVGIDHMYKFFWTDDPEQM